MLGIILLTGAVVFGCQCARWYLEREDRKESEHLGGRIRLTALRNDGSAFGLLPIKGGALAALSAAVMALCVWLYRGCRLGCALLLGGGISNLWERVRHGSVFDYIVFPKASEKLRRYVFNLADIAIFLGAIAIVLGTRKRKE